MTPEQRILAAVRKGQPVTPTMTCDTIDSLPELDAYRDGLQSRGALDDTAKAAIATRRAELAVRR
jgi:hypothetical protein